MKKKRSQTGAISNRRARFDYDLKESYMAGVVLNGRETKALRLGRGQLQGAYVTFQNGEVFLLNATIHGTNGIPVNESESTQTRKLLLKQREIDELYAAKQQGNTIIPTEILTKGRFIKVRIAIGRGKKAYDKRHTIKKRDTDRESRRISRL